MVALLRSEPFDLQLLTLAGLWCVGLWVLPVESVTLQSRSAVAACRIALLVHLCGAGGISMPAIAQVLLVLMLVTYLGAVVPAVAGDRRAPPWTSGVASLGLFGAFVACLLTAALPVTLRNAHLQIARADAFAGRSPSAVENEIAQAIASDPLSSEPWEQQATLLMMMWERTNGQNTALFDTALESQTEAIRRDPENPNRYRTLADFCMRRHLLTGETSAAEAALRALDEALVRYPTEASLWAETARMADEADQPERVQQAAARALQLDRLNRDRQHWDRVLAEDRVDWLQSAAGESLKPSGVE